MINKFEFLLWFNISIILLILSLKLTKKSHFVQLRLIKMFKALLKKNNQQGITNFQSLMMTLGGKIGVGSISGIAIAIYYGGIGTILWMIIISVIISVFTYYEVYLGNTFKELDEENIYKGGPSYYIKKGLKKPKLSILYTLLIIISYNGCFLSIQSNTIMKMTKHIFNINPIIIGISICLITFIIIYNGIKNIATISNILVPIMLTIYITLAIFILLNNLNKLPNIITLIIKDAFNIKTFIVSFIPMIITSIKRSIFATESGIGTTSIASSTTSSDPKTQGYIQVLGVHITTFIICLATAIIILTTNYHSLNLSNINGIELVIYAFSFHFGKFGNTILYVIVLSFCFSTIISGYYNGESCLKSLNIKNVFILKICTVIILFLGVITSAKVLWNISDIFLGLILSINIYAVYKLKNIVKE